MSGPTKPIQTPADQITPANPENQMTGDQADRLRALCDETGEAFDSTLSQEAAARRIEELQAKTDD